MTRRRARLVATATVLTVAVLLWLRACSIPEALGLATHPVKIVATGGTGASGIDFDFSGLVPGNTRSATIVLRNPTDRPEAVWLVFDNANGTWSAINRLGQLGRITIGDRVYDNLDNRSPAVTPGVPGAPGGGFLLGACASVPKVGANYLPHAIPLGTLQDAGVLRIAFTFEYRDCMTDGKGQPVFAPTIDGIEPVLGAGALTLSAMAFQDGVDPRSSRNGTGELQDLDLGAYAPYVYQ